MVKLAKTRIAACRLEVSQTVRPVDGHAVWKWLKLIVFTWIVFPFIAVTTSPGFVAQAPGIFSQSGINAAENTSNHVKR